MGRAQLKRRLANEFIYTERAMSDTLGGVLRQFFERHEDRPAKDPQGFWVVVQVDEALERLVTVVEEEASNEVHR